MGIILSAFCEKCGFEKEVWFGAGMDNFMTVCNVPALNKKSGRFVIKNILKKGNSSRDFNFYNESGMFQGTIENDDLQWDDVILKESGNLCPNCKLFSMKFFQNGCFD
jgi:hypothetical protein